MNRTCFLSSLVYLLLAALISSCSITRRVPEGRHLLVDNELNVDNNRVDKEDLKTILKQTPNRKILGIWRFHLRIFNLAGNKRDGKFWEYLRNTVGEKPVLLDSNLTYRSSRQLELYLRKKGYFDAVVTDTTILFRKNRARVIYNLESGQPYFLRSVKRLIPDPYIVKLLDMDSSSTVLRSKMIYDEDVLSAERDRITNYLRNEGYYYFTRDYLYYEVDTALPGRMIDVTLKLSEPQTTSGESIDHKRYYIQNVYVITDYQPGVEKQYADTVPYNGLSFLYNDQLTIKPVVVGQHSFLKPGDLFQQRNTEETYRKLTNLRIFQSVNVVFREPPGLPPGSRLLDAYIYLSPMIRQSIDDEIEGTNRSGNLGVAGSIHYTNRNTFRGGELLEVRMKGGLEAQRYDTTAVKTEDDKLFFFNTVEFGPEISLTLPRFLLPVKAEKFSKYFTPKTTLTAAYNYQKRPELTRRILNFQFGYNWRENENKTHIANLVELNFVKIRPEEEFQDFLDLIDNPFIERTYTNHMTLGSNYTFIYNSRRSHNIRTGHYFFTRAGADWGGNLLRLGFNAADATTYDGSYHIFDVPFAQYAKIDIDQRYYRIFHEKHNVAFRVAGGVGVPFKNLNVLPLEKSYFIGGANSLRAWPARTLGPGSYFPGPSQVSTLRIGDLIIEGNAEYRFDLIKIVEGALFVDAGNIWLLNRDDVRPGGQFHITNFYRQLAVGSGAGVRLDFSFFIFRFDLGLKLRDPMLPYDENWVITNLFDQDWKDNYRDQNGASYRFTSFNLGIGYPF